MEIEISKDIEKCIELSFEAGKEILEVYQQDFDVELKGDDSPLTEADKRAHNVIVAGLNSFSLPILSEEGRDIPYEERKSWETFWLVDPLDGTKEFVKKNGEFTVNIAKVHQGESIAGVIYAPVLKTLYWAEKGKGAFMCSGISSLDEMEEVSHLKEEEVPQVFRVVGSRSHMNDETKSFIENEIQGKAYEVVSKGSSLKFCLMAEGAADLYPRLAPTMEWDTAAGQIIAEEAGKKVYRYDNGEPLRYNKEDLLNPWFVVK